MDVTPTGAPARRFLGWEYARTQGPEYLEQFLRPFDGLLAVPESAAPEAGNWHSGLASLEANGERDYPGFALRRSLPAGYIPTGVAAADFNRDGLTDWVVSNGGQNNLYLYFGRGNGSAELPVILPLAGASPVWVATGDLNGDGQADLVVAEADSRTVGVLLGNGDGTFAAESQITFPVPPIFVVLGDLDGDGNLDLLVGLFGDTSTGRFATLLGDGRGHFGPPTYAPRDPGTAGMSGEWLSVGDVNRDGILDVLATGGTARGLSTRIFLGRGDGTFTLGQLLLEASAIGRAPLTGELADVNEDGCADAVVPDTFGLVTLLFSNCDGTFDLTEDYRTLGVGDIPYGVALADVDRDGHLDLVTSGIWINVHPIYGQIPANSVSVLRGDGQGNFTPARTYRGEPAMFALALADLNGDGWLDIITADQNSDTSTVFLNDGTGGFGDPQGLYFGYHTGRTSGTINPSQPFGLYMTDVDGDDHPDIALLKVPPIVPGNYQIAVMLNDGTGHFSSPVRTPSLPYQPPVQVGDFIFADFRNTGRPDFLVIGSQYSGGIPMLGFAANVGGGSFGPTTLTAPPDTQGILAVGDFNRDGKLDFVVAGGPVSFDAPFRLTVFLGNGDGTFTRGFSTDFGRPGPLGLDPRLIFVGDYNHDGRLDVLIWVHDNVIGRQNHDVYQLLGNGDGTFAPARIVLPDFNPFTVADLNHDGLPDIVEVSDGNPPRFTIYLGQPDGTYHLTQTYEPYSGILFSQFWGAGSQPNRFPAMFGDFDGDGNLDIAVFQVPTSSPLSWAYVQILAGNGDGTFTPTYATFDFHKWGSPQFAWDVTGDGRADLIEHDAYTASLNILPAMKASALQTGLLRQPIVGSRGTLRVNLNVPSSSPTVVMLSPSDPAIRIPPSVTIPTGRLTQDVPFDLDIEFDSYRVFSIEGQVGAHTAVAYGTKALPNVPTGIGLSLQVPTRSVYPGGTTPDYGPVLSSRGGYYSDEVRLECRGLPTGARCQFGRDRIRLQARSRLYLTLTVSTAPDVPLGTYNFTVVATDGDATAESNATLIVAPR